MKLREKWNALVEKTQSKVTDLSTDKDEKTDLMDKVENTVWEKLSKLKLAKALTPVLSVFGFLIITWTLSGGQGRCVVPVWHKERTMPRAMQQMLPPDAQ